MRRPLEQMLNDVLAAHLEISASSIKPDLELLADLGIYPLGLVLIALDIEDIEGVELPIERLEDVKTVADLARVVRDACRESRQPSWQVSTGSATL